MFNSMKRRALKEEFKKIRSDGFRQLPEGRSMPQPEVEEDADTFRVNHFLKETAALRGQIETERRINPDQQVQLNAIAERLGIEPPLDENYRKFRELWAAENGEQVYLAPVDAPILLRPDEQCCFSELAIWGQLKVTKTSFGYSGFSTTFPIMKGANYRIGSLKPRYKVSDGIKEMAIGSLYITNKRLFFNGGSLSTTITFNGIVNIECYSNGMEVGKTNDRNDFFQMTPLSSEYAYMIIQEINRLR